MRYEELGKLIGEPILSLGEAAITLGVSRTTMKNLIESGQLPAVKIGKTTAIRRSAFDALVPKAPA